jgi:hypothetical protein
MKPLLPHCGPAAPSLLCDIDMPKRGHVNAALVGFCVRLRNIARGKAPPVERLRWTSDCRDNLIQTVDSRHMEAGNTGRGVLFPIAHSLNKSSELSQFERWRDAVLAR